MKAGFSRKLWQFILGLLAVVGTVHGDENERAAKWIDAQAASFSGTKIEDPGKFAEIVSSWKELPAYQIPGLIDELALRAAKAESDAFRGALPVAAIEARDTVPGRAVWAIEQLSGVRFKSLFAKTGQRVLEPREILLFAHAFKCGMLANAIDLRPRDQEIARLSSLFHGKMNEGISKEAFDSGPQFRRFLEQWRPIGKKPVEIAIITGLKGKWNDETSILNFDFDSGFAGVSFSLEVIGDRIASVRQNAID